MDIFCRMMYDIKSLHFFLLFFLFSTYTGGGKCVCVLLCKVLTLPQTPKDIVTKWGFNEIVKLLEEHEVSCLP